MCIDVLTGLKRSFAVGMVVLTTQGIAFSVEQPLSLPAWLTNDPQAKIQAEKRLPWSASVEYAAASVTSTVVTHYKEQLQKASVTYSAKFDGVGTTISANADGTSCVVRISEADAGSAVRVNCAPEAPVPGAPNFHPMLPPPPAVTAPVEAAPSALAKPAPNLHKVEYSVTGSVYKVVMYGRDSKGALEKEVDVRLPYYRTFDAVPGTPLFLSAEKSTVRTAPFQVPYSAFGGMALVPPICQSPELSFRLFVMSVMNSAGQMGLPEV